MENSVFVLGSGPLGLILSSNLSEKASSVTLCWHDSAEAARMRRDGGTRLLNQDFFFPDNVEIADRTAYLPDDCILIVAISSRELEETMEAMLASFKDRSGLIVLFTKGLPSYTARKKYNARTFCEYMEKFSHDRGIHQLKFAAVNGPSLLSELYHGSYSFLNVGCADTEAGKRIAELLSNDRIQCGYTSDTIGVEMGGVLKNPIAIASGIATNLAECGGNFAGELIQHGFQEMLSLALAIGARQETLIGRSGIADLMTTCLGKESRNRAYGEDFIKRLQSGSEEHGVMDRIETFLNPARVIQKDAAQGQDVVEGAYAIASIVEIAAELKVEVPLYNALYEILSRRSPPSELISAITGAPVRASEPQVLHRRQGLHLAAGTDFVEVLSSRVFHSVQVTKGMQSRIKKQATQVLTQLDKRLQKAKKVKNRMDLQKIPHERDLWLSFSSSIGESESRALRQLIQFYAEEIADSYTPGMRETLIRLLAPVRFAASGFKLGSAMPKIGGNTEELKNLAAHYNVMYTPTHRSHLDSVEVAFGLSWLSVPLPRYAAGINLMADQFQSWLLRSFGAYAVDRERTRNFLYLECLSSYACLMLESGIPSLVYPEGTRSRDGKIVGIKTGLLSTAVSAYQNTGREVVVMPLALSYESVPEDSFYCGLGEEPGLKEFINKRGSAYLDICDPIRVSRHMSADDPTLSISMAIVEQWRKHLRILPNQILARILSDNGHAVPRASLPGLVEEFVMRNPGNYLTRDADAIVDQGIASLRERNIAKEDGVQLASVTPVLASYYGGMVPESGGTILDQDA